MSGIEIAGIVLAVLGAFVSSRSIYAAVQSAKKKNRYLDDVKTREQAVTCFLEDPLTYANFALHEPMYRNFAKSQERLYICKCSIRGLQLEAGVFRSEAALQIQRPRDWKRFLKAIRAIFVRRPVSKPGASSERAWLSCVHQRDIAGVQSEIHAEEKDEYLDEKYSFEPLEHTNSTSRCQCVEGLRWRDEREHHRTPRYMRSAAHVVMLVGRITPIYQVCMLIMSNYAITRCSEGCDAGAIAGFQHEVKQPMESPRRFSDIFQSSTISKFTPEFMSHPSPYVFFAASMTWTFLEWAHYRSNLEHEYQSAILGIAIILGLLPAIGCTANTAAVLFCTLPWAIDLGILVSDILHNAAPRDRIS
jgi:hypothetical protein